MIVFEHEK